MNNSMKVLASLAAGAVLILLIIILSPKTPVEKISPIANTPSEPICSTGWLPVCGKDGKTYTNSCTAEKINKVSVAYVGECRDEATETDKTDTGSVESVTEVVPVIPDVESGS